MLEPANAPEPTTVPSALLHDLKTPLGQIIGYAEMLLEQADEAETEAAELAPDLTKIRAAAAQLQTLLETKLRALSPTENSAPASIETLAPATDEAEPPTDLASGTENGLLLIVDDVEANRDVLSRRLKREGYQIETAASGADALEMVHQSEFDLVLLDIMMPEMDGYEVLRQLKADPNTRPIPVIMISALDEIESVVRCIEMGAEDYLAKPFNKTLLRARIGASLEKKRAHDREARLFSQLETNYRRLQQLEKMRDDLTHMIVHDLRTPLSSLLAGLQTIPMVAPLVPAQQECFDIALRGGFTLLGMINDLLDISKFESGTLQLETAPLSIETLVAESWEQVASAAQMLEITLRHEIAADLPIVAGDGGKLRRTLVNLLGNAIKFSSPRSNVTVGARVVENEVLCWVRDRGEGIPPEAFERIFEKFGQVENRRAGRQMSTGLGLALCKLVVEAHGGRIWVESTLGQGSTFYFALPLKAQMSPQAPELTASKVAATA